MLREPVPKIEADVSVCQIADAFQHGGNENFSLVVKLFAWKMGKVGIKDSPFLMTFSDNTTMLMPETLLGTPVALYEVELCLKKPFLLLNQLNPRDSDLFNPNFLGDLIDHGYDSIVITEHSWKGGKYNFLVVLDMKACFLRDKLLGTYSSDDINELSEDAKPNIADLEQDNPERIKFERDALAEAIGIMGIKLGHIRPDALLTGPHLIQICEDIVKIHEVEKNEVSPSVFELMDDLMEVAKKKKDIKVTQF